ncbi:MAG TPA: type II toxin-antitoxin system VapB family antitoxin [Gemmatimonadaceae bacterium]|nr:type II toxin-antitoxin system VapB family antitoxin [Gemmatimonadaceae bacterium]
MSARKSKKGSARSGFKSRGARETSANEYTGSPGLKKATLFMNGRSQAVRLPKEFRFEGTHVFVTKRGNSVILSPTDDRMTRILAAMGSMPDFPDRDQGPPQERPELDTMFDR